jgi:hypothetical protein
MAMSRRALFLALTMVWSSAVSATAQTASAELDLTAGRSGEEISAAAAQGRVFGDSGGRTAIQYFVEAAWGQRWAGDYTVIGGGLVGADPMGTDVFGAAYPYSKRVLLIESYAERYFKSGRFMAGARGGLFRMPFGIYGRSEYAYTGFIRPPLIRYDGYFALSNNYFEKGAMFTAGIPELFVETSIGRPRDIGSSHRRSGRDESIRVQGYYGQLIVGVSHARSEPYMPARFAHGRQVFTGTDLRWAHSSGIQLRGEYLKGQSYSGVSTVGWYLDGSVHHAGMGPLTAVVRDEALDYAASPPFARSAHRWTLGARIRLPKYFTAQLNYMHQRGDLPRIYNNSVDMTVTYSFRYH